MPICPYCKKDKKELLTVTAPKIIFSTVSNLNTQICEYCMKVFDSEGSEGLKRIIDESSN